MKVSLVMGIWWVWWAMMVVQGTLGYSYTTIKFNLANTPTGSYPSFLTSLRNQLQGQLVCQIQVTKLTVGDSQRFVLVQLQTTTTKYVTLAIDVLDLYVVGYNSNGVRANFLQGVPDAAHKNLWVELSRRNTTFDGSYTALEKAAGKKYRDEIALGFVQLKSAIESVIVTTTSKTVKAKEEAKFFIIAIQMISEAARFKYIENQVNVATLRGVQPNSKVIELETSWEKISKGIQKSSPVCTTMPELTLKYANGSQWKVNRVDQIRPDLGILKKNVAADSQVKSSSIN